jgi:hypothetical protein
VTEVYEKESAIELTKRLMKEEPAYRLRMTEREITFLLHILEERVETAEDLMGYGIPKRDDRLTEQKNIKLVAKDLARRFSGTLEGKKRHFGFKAWWKCGDLISYWKKQDKNGK